MEGQDGQRYAFGHAEWKNDAPPRAGLSVDFEVAEGRAVAIYCVGTAIPLDQRTMAGVGALALTFFLGFIGTLVSRLVLAKQEPNEVLWPTIAHLIISVLAFIPLLGVAIYIGGTLYFMVKNYQLVMQITGDDNRPSPPSSGNKYLRDEG